MSRDGAVVLCVATLWAFAPSAAGASSGVTVDPNSPAGKEYAIPLEQARRQAAGSNATSPVGQAADASGRSGQGGVALFGEGISPSPPTSRGSGDNPSLDRKRRSNSTGGDPSTSAGATAGTVATRATAGTVATHKGTVTALTGGLALAVIALGAGLGTMIRLRSRNR